MSATPEDIFELVKTIRFDLTALQGKVTTLNNMLGEVTHSIPPKDASEWICPRCQIDKRSESRLADHMALVHNVGMVDELMSDRGSR